MASLLNNVAEAYDTTKSYVYGNYATYDEMLYICISPTSGTFDADCWQETYLTDLLRGNNGASTPYGVDYLAPNYDSEDTVYNTDDAVIYDDVLYICKEESVSGAFDSTKWEKSTLVECGDLQDNAGCLTIQDFYDSLGTQPYWISGNAFAGGYIFLPVYKAKK